MRVGLFGGSFDPIHYGHLRPVQAARRTLALDRVVYLPTAQPPHKPERHFAPAHARFAMVEMALLKEEGLYASAHELTPDRPAYTVETVEHFRREQPEAELYLIIGSDSFAELDTWYRWRQIVQQVEIVVLERPTAPLGGAGSRLSAELTELAASRRVHRVQEEMVEVSSTELRELFARGQVPEADRVPDLVINYIRKYGFYR